MENSSLNSKEHTDLKLKLEAFHKQLLDDAEPIIDHDFLNEELQSLTDSWECIKKLLEQEPSQLKDHDPDSLDKEKNKNLLRQRNIKKASDNVEETYQLFKFR